MTSPIINPSHRQRLAIVLAGGKGTRMKSEQPKVLHDVLGKSMLHRVLECLQSLQNTPYNLQEVFIVIGHQLDAVQTHVNQQTWPFKITFVEQSPQLGTGHAMMQVAKSLPATQDVDVLITCGDMPLVQTATYEAAFKALEPNPKIALSMVSVEMDNPTGYGRVIFDAFNEVQKIVEEKDATVDEKAVQWINTGIYAAHWPKLSAILDKLSPNNAQNEYYLTDCVQFMRQAHEVVSAVKSTDALQMLGVNSQADLAQACQTLSQRHISDLMAQGVRFIAPQTCTIAPEVYIEAESTIYPGCTFLGSVKIGHHCDVLHSVLERDVTIGNHCYIGPYAHIRDNVKVGNHCKLGNFVEIKEAVIGDYSNAAHLCYLGDVTLGDNVNMGAGSVIANYDPIRDIKHRSEIKDDVKVGCNATIISPITVETGACIAAGSTVTSNIAANDLVIARSRETVVQGWVKKIKDSLFSKA